MITDKLNMFSGQTGQAVTATAASTDVIDLGPLTHGNTRRDIGAGEPLYLVIAVLVAATAAGAGQQQIGLLDHPVEDGLRPVGDGDLGLQIGQHLGREIGDRDPGVRGPEVHGQHDATARIERKSGGRATPGGVRFTRIHHQTAGEQWFDA